jgi:hypothetical protein
MTKMEFVKYQHIERFGTDEVEGIELGTCYVFPKLDGSNGSVWLHETGIKAGSRNRELTLDDDNQGFYAYILQHKGIEEFLIDFPNMRLFGEWLVPHTLKSYRDDVWRRFWVFDITVQGGDSYRYLHQAAIEHLCKEYAIDYITPIGIIENGDYDSFFHLHTNHNTFLIQDGKGVGEGVVIKNYEFVNKYGRTTWAKIVSNEFKEQAHKNFGSPKSKGKKQVEMDIAQHYVTEALVSKEYAKIVSDDGWQSKKIPQLLNTVYYCVVKEEAWDFVKKHKNPTIDFTKLKNHVFNAVKQIAPNLF